MKILITLLALLGSLLLASADQASARWREPIDNTTRFIFYAVLEGCYEDGISTKDVDQILLRADNGKGGRLHFIYACPICGATVGALETYRVRPENPFNLKVRVSTFGEGLPEATEKRLFSPDQRERLGVINELTKFWLERRMTAMHLPADERAALMTDLEKKRKQGMDVLKGFRHDANGPNSLTNFAPGYLDIDECAVCNGAVGKPMKLPNDKPTAK